MNLSLKPNHLKRYQEIFRLITRHGGSDLVRAAQDQQAGWLDSGLNSAEDGKPEELAADLEALGPTFIKLGQVLSSRPDLLPASYVEPLSRLQDKVESFPFEQVEEIVSRELGTRISRAFDRFDEKPVAAASLGQVHRARLRGGREVAVKVQRPNIRETVRHDLEILDELAGFVDSHTSLGRQFIFRDLLEMFRRSLIRELDYLQEARNLQAMRENLSDYELLVIPAPVPDYTTSAVLTMEYVEGTKVSGLNPVVRLELNGEALADSLSRAYLDQILVHGLVHADPHPGNVFVTPEHKLALIDLGMVTRVRPELQEKLLKLLLAITDGRGDEVADTGMELGTKLENFNRTRFRREVADLVVGIHVAPAEDLQVGRVLMEVARLSGANGLRPSPELAMLGKTLFNLDQVARALDPKFDPNASIRSHTASLFRKRMVGALAPGNVVSNALEMNELISQLPRRLNRLLDAVADGEIDIRVKTMDETRVLAHIQKLGNRIALGLLLAALIVGAAMLMQIDTDFTLLGYPGLAMILFIAAAGLGFSLVVRMMIDGSRLHRRDKP